MAARSLLMEQEGVMAVIADTITYNRLRVGFCILLPMIVILPSAGRLISPYQVTSLSRGSAGRHLSSVAQPQCVTDDGHRG
jgi:hypothetical protein